MIIFLCCQPDTHARHAPDTQRTHKRSERQAANARHAANASQQQQYPPASSSSSSIFFFGPGRCFLNENDQLLWLPTRHARQTRARHAAHAQTQRTPGSERQARSKRQAAWPRGRQPAAAAVYFFGPGRFFYLCVRFCKKRFETGRWRGLHGRLGGKRAVDGTG